MSYHILHVFQHGALLGRERGFITCRAQDHEERRLPLEDVRAIRLSVYGRRCVKFEQLSNEGDAAGQLLCGLSSEIPRPPKTPEGWPACSRSTSNGCAKPR